MSFQIRCSCGKVLSVKEEDAGKTGQCPACGSRFAIPQAAGPPPGAQTSHAPGPPDPALSRKLETQAKIGLICGLCSALLGAALFGVAYYVGSHFQVPGPRPPEPPIAAALVMFGCCIAGIVTSILAIVFSGLGLRRGNTTNRGSAVTGLVLGILVLLANFCCVFLALIGMTVAMGSRVPRP